MSLLCIYLSLLAFIITFLSGVQNSAPQSSSREEQNLLLDSDQHIEPDAGSCTAVTALLHLFLLATFSWNSVYGTQLVLLVRSMHRSLPPYWTPLSVGVGWGTRVQSGSTNLKHLPESRSRFLLQSVLLVLPGQESQWLSWRSHWQPPTGWTSLWDTDRRSCEWSGLNRFLRPLDAEQMFDLLCSGSAAAGSPLWIRRNASALGNPCSGLSSFLWAWF